MGIPDVDEHNAVAKEFNCNPALMVQEILKLRREQEGSKRPFGTHLAQFIDILKRW